MFLLNLTTHYIFFGISIYSSYFHLSRNFPRAPPLSLVLIAHLQSIQAVSGGKAPELWVGSVQGGAEPKEQKTKLLDLLPAWDVSDALAGSQMSCLHPVLCCQLLWNFYGFVCLPKLPPPDLNHPWEQERHCRNWGDLNPPEFSWVGDFWRAVGGCQEQSWFVM